MAVLVYQRVNVPTLQHLGIQCTNEYIQHLGIGENSPEKHAGNPSFGNHGILFFFETIHWQPFGRPKGDESMFYRQVFKDPPAVRKSRLQSRVECGNSTACSSERSENTFRNNHFSLFYFNEVKSCFATFAFFSCHSLQLERRDPVSLGRNFRRSISSRLVKWYEIVVCCHKRLTHQSFYSLWQRVPGEALCPGETGFASVGMHRDEWTGRLQWLRRTVHVRARLCTVRLYKSEFSDEFLQWVRNSEDSEDSENSEASVSGSYEPGT